MSKITKGEWRVIHEPFCVSVESDDDIIYERYLSDVHDHDSIDELQEALATAALVCAAPHMIKALKKISFRCECFMEDERNMRATSISAIKVLCDEAIAKALASNS